MSARVGLCAALVLIGCGGDGARGGDGAHTAGSGGSAGTQSSVGGSGGATGFAGAAPGGSASLTTGGVGGLAAGGSAGSGSRPTSMLGACHLYLDAWCQRMVDCTASEDVDRCKEQEYALCPDLFFSPGTTRTVDGLAACATDISQMTCLDWEQDNWPSCVSPGTRAEGESCVFSSQCQSLECAASGDSCGTCLPIANLGELCGDNAACGPGQRCNGVCELIPAPPPGQMPPDPSPVPPGLAQGMSCGLMDSCAQGLWCLLPMPWPADVPADSKPGTCDVLPAANAPCAFERFASGASCAEGAYCDAASTTCQPLPTSGEPCLTFPFPDCALGFFCDRTVNADGVCTAQGDLGAACSVSVPCLADLSCVPAMPGGAFSCHTVAQEGQDCTAQTSQCEAGTQCQGGICVATDELTTFSSLCGQ
ncbi:MAG TPA: hypothetical protein VL137_16195 [Polyangiaceae bacterium]|nr:hypothetical protein [Polyangiaceae bacterium]